MIPPLIGRGTALRLLWVSGLLACGAGNAPALRCIVAESDGQIKAVLSAPVFRLPGRWDSIWTVPRSPVHW